MSSKINYVGLANSLGYGQAGVHLLQALDELGAEPAFFPLGGLEIEERHERAVKAALGRAPFYNPDAPSFRLYHQWDMALHVGRGPRAGYAFWEVDRLTEQEVHQLSAMDIMFVPSAWAREVAAESGVTTRLEVLPCGVDTAVFHPGVEPLPSIDRTETVFLTVGKFEVRKGHAELVDAFNAAFTPNDPVRLIMHCFNPLNLPGYDGPAESKRWSEMFARTPMGQAGRIACTAGRVRCQSDLASLMAAADCGVFPSRAEGWGLPLAEMLAMGKQAIATDYAAHTEFVGPAGARLISIDGLEPAYDGFFFKGHGRWARLGPAQFDQLIEHLRAVHAVKQHRGSLPTNAAGIDLFQSKLTWKNAANHILETLGAM